MYQQFMEVLRQGEATGNGMIVRFRFPSGLTVYGLPTPNDYGGEWDLGPTWNYLVLADRPFLVDAGRWGTGGLLVETIQELERPAREVDFVLLSHGHEDHDGGLAEVKGRLGATVKAHAVYGKLCRQYPDLAPSENKRAFPAKCWNCFMPESFYSANCLEYHQDIKERPVQDIGDGRNALGPGLETWHLPGHSPDALALRAGEELLIVGDNLLPGITPWPSSQRLHALHAGVLGADYPEADTLYGLKRYLKSLGALRELGRAHPEMVVLPAHRLYYGDQFNGLALEERAREIIQHHGERCAAILAALAQGPQDVDSLTPLIFEPSKIKGPGFFMAKNELICHCELLAECGDVAQLPGGAYRATSAENYTQLIAEILDGPPEAAA